MCVFVVIVDVAMTVVGAALGEYTREMGSPASSIRLSLPWNMRIGSANVDPTLENEFGSLNELMND